MKNLIKLAALMLFVPMVTFAASVETRDANELPLNCQAIGNIQVGDSSSGLSRQDVVAELSRESANRGGNYVLMDIQRVNNPKRGVHFWGWGKVGICK